MTGTIPQHRPDPEAPKFPTQIEFEKRLEQYEAARRQKMRRTQREAQANLSFHPKISTKSRAIAASPERHGAANYLKEPVYDRLSTPRLAKHHCDGAVAVSESLTPSAAHPTINPRSQYLPKRSVDYHHSGNRGQREQKLQRLREEKAAAELREVCVSPSINRNVEFSTKSFLQHALRLPASEYVQVVRGEGNRRQQKLNELREEVEQNASMTCTFRPEVHEAPEYIRTIATTLSMAKPSNRQKEVCSRGHAHTPTRDFRFS